MYGVFYIVYAYVVLLSLIVSDSVSVALVFFFFAGGASDSCSIFRSSWMLSFLRSAESNIPTHHKVDEMRWLDGVASPLCCVLTV